MEKGIYFIAHDSTGSIVKLYDFTSGKVKKLFDMKGINANNPSFSPDRQSMLCNYTESVEIDIMLVENFRWRMKATKPFLETEKKNTPTRFGPGEKSRVNFPSIIYKLNDSQNHQKR